MSQANPNVTTTGADEGRHRFVGGLGHVTDDETGLIYMRARHYDPETGRFLSEDPAKHGVNWFAYANNNPVGNVDFSGRTSGNVNEVGQSSAISQEAEGEGGAVYLQVLKSVRGTIADFNKAKWYNDAKLIREIKRTLNASDEVANNVIHGAKEYQGMGGANNVGLDSAGGLWTKTGEFIGFIDDFIF